MNLATDNLHISLQHGKHK